MLRDNMMSLPDEDVSKALTLPEVRYSRVWEDNRVLSKALCVQPQDTVLCITRYIRKLMQICE